MAKHNVKEADIVEFYNSAQEIACDNTVGDACKSPRNAIKYAKSLSEQLECLTKLYHNHVHASQHSIQLLEREQQSKLDQVHNKNTLLKQRYKYIAISGKVF